MEFFHSKWDSFIENSYKENGICPNCEAIIPIDSEECPKCGEELVPITEVEESSSGNSVAEYERRLANSLLNADNEGKSEKVKSVFRALAAQNLIPWVYQELNKGRSEDDVVEELVEMGLEREEAEELVGYVGSGGY